MLPTLIETLYTDRNRQVLSRDCMHTDKHVESNRNQQACSLTLKQHSRKHSQNVHTGHGCQGHKMHDRSCLITTRLHVQHAPDLHRWCPFTQTAASSRCTPHQCTEICPVEMSSVQPADWCSVGTAWWAQSVHMCE